MESTEPTSTTPENTGTTQTEVELVRVEDADDSEIADFLKDAEAKNLDAEPDSEDVDESEDEPTTESEPEPQVADDPKHAVQETYTRAEVEAIQKQLLEQRTALEQKEAFIQRRNNELGQSRRELAEANAYLKKLISEDSFESPAHAAEAVIQLRENQKELEAIETEQQQTQYLDQWHGTVRRFVDPRQVHIDDAVEILREHQVDSGTIENFRRDPARAAGPLEAVYLFEAAKWRKTAKSLVSYVQKLQGDLEKSKGKPEQVLRSVDKALRSSPQITGSAGASSSRKSGKDTDITKWSDAELSEFLKSQS